MRFIIVGYDVREPVEVRIMEDRIHIVSYPGPDRSISEKSIEDKNMIARKYRNRRIGEFLKELKLTECSIKFKNFNC